MFTVISPDKQMPAILERHEAAIHSKRYSCSDRVQSKESTEHASVSILYYRQDENKGQDWGLFKIALHQSRKARGGARRHGGERGYKHEPADIYHPMEKKGDR